MDVGGLDTPLASLISMKLYCRSRGVRSGRYLLVFTLVNVLQLALLSAAQRLL